MMGDFFPAGTWVERLDGREFPNGKYVTQIIPRVRGPEYLVWVEGGTPIDKNLIKQVVEPNLPAPKVEADREANLRLLQGDEPKPPTPPPAIDWEKRYKQELAYRRRDEKRAAKVNKENAALRKKLREMDWAMRAQKILLDSSAYHYRKYQAIFERLQLVKDVVNTPYDDWIAEAGEPTTEKK